MAMTSVLFIGAEALRASRASFQLDYVSAETFTVRVTARLDTCNTFTFF